MNENKFGIVKEPLKPKSNAVKLVDGKVVDNLDEEKIMSKKLAIKGHSTRGNEVIELLEMMGGKNTYGYDGEMKSLYFTIYNDTIIYGSYKCLLNDNYVFFHSRRVLGKISV